MARINIEDSLFKDDRFFNLCLHYGDKTKALGALVWAFIIAQRFYLELDNDRLIPTNEWARQGCDDILLRLGFAEQRDNGIYVCGSEKQFKWLIQRSEAGKRGGKYKRKPRSRSVNGTSRDSVGSNPLTLPLISSSSSLLSSTNSDSVVQNQTSADKPAGPTINQIVWDRYQSAYKDRYKADPVRNAKVNSQIAQLVKRLGVDAPDVVAFFLTHNKTYYVSRLHNLGLCLSDAEALRTQWVRGKAITNLDIERFEKASNAAELNKLIDEGKI